MLGCPFFGGCFWADKNASLLRNGSVYEYIRDHLGYRLELSSAVATVTPAASAQHGPGGGTAIQSSTADVAVQIAVERLLQNNGVSAPVNVRAWHIALLSPPGSGKVAWRSAGMTGADADVDWRLLYPHLPGDPVRQPLVHGSFDIILVHPCLSAAVYRPTRYLRRVLNVHPCPS